MTLTPEQKARGRRDFLKAIAGVPPLAAFAGAAAWRGPVPGGPVRAGFIGSGLFGQALLGHCRPTVVDIRAICDINPKHRKDAAAALVERGWTRPTLYEDWRELLAREDIEAVLIATPLWTHAEIAVGALEAGRHVFVEKMMAYDMDGCRRMTDAARRGRRVLEVGYARFYSPRNQAAHEQVIRRGLIGDIHHVRLMYHRNRSWRRDLEPPFPGYDPSPWGYPTWDHLANWRLYRRYSQGLVAELGSHQIGTVNQLLESTPTAALGAGGVHRFTDREVNDHVYVILEYPGDRTVTFSSIESNDFDGTAEVFMGTNGTLVLGREAMLFTDDDQPTTIEMTPRGTGAVVDASESRVEDAAGRADRGTAVEPDRDEEGASPFAIEIATFCAAIRTGAELRCGPERASRINAACLAANRAIESGTRVPIAPLT